MTNSNNNVHPLDGPMSQEPAYRPHSRLSGSFTGPQATSQETRLPLQQQPTFHHPVTPPSYYEGGFRPSDYGGEQQDRAFEVDPRLWGPLDSMSLYAITSQAAKRVVAQSKALSSSVNGLHMYYSTSLA